MQLRYEFFVRKFLGQRVFNNAILSESLFCKIILKHKLDLRIGSSLVLPQLVDDCLQPCILLVLGASLQSL